MKSALAGTVKLFEKVRADDADVALTPFGKRTEELLEEA